MNHKNDRDIHDEEWTVVHRTSTSKRKVAPRQKYGLSGSNATKLLLLVDDNSSDDDDVVSPDTVVSHLAACSQQLTASQFYNNVVQAWKKAQFWRNDDDGDDHDEYEERPRVIDEVVCYGIGNFSQRLPASNNHRNHSYNNYSGPLWQLALALEMQKMASSYNKQEQQHHPEPSISRMVYFDPLVTQVESQVLQNHYKVVVLDHNERGLRSTHTINNLTTTNNDTTTTTSTPTASTTLFFMPHCPKGLYENVLWANWHALQQDPQSIGIIGNSLVTYVERATTSSSSSTTTSSATHNKSKNSRDNSNNKVDKSCLELVQPFVREQLISYTRRDIRDMPGQFEAAFNDIYLTTFCHHHHPQDTNPNNDSCYYSQQTMWPERPPQPSEDGQNEVL